MQCIRPLYAVDYHIVKSNGKKTIRILRPDELAHFRTYDDLITYYGRDNVLKLPCGKCDACRQNYATQWAVRCVLEAKYHKDCIFLTLTYSDEFLPDNDDKLKKDFSKFIKDLRNQGFKFRYFGCGEHGDLNDRRHLHMILFGFKPDDMKCEGIGRNGGYYYSSKFLRDIWSKGHIVIGDFNYATAKYVASYCVGKDKKTSFVRMSRKPGIGFPYLVDKVDEIYSYDCIYGNFGQQKVAHPPRAFDEYAKDVLKKDLDSIAEMRKVKGENIEADLRAKVGAVFLHELEAFNQRKINNKKRKRSL